MAASVSVSPVLYVLTHYSKSFLLDLWNKFNAHVILNPPEYSLHETPCRRLWGAAALSALWKPNLLILIILRLSFMWQAVVCFCVQLCVFIPMLKPKMDGTSNGNIGVSCTPSQCTHFTYWMKQKYLLNLRKTWVTIRLAKVGPTGRIWSTKQPTKKLRKCSPF